MLLDRQIAIIAMFTRGGWRGRGQVASAALSQDRAGHNHGHNSHYPRLIDGGWENVYLAQVCPSVPHPLSCESPRC